MIPDYFAFAAPTDYMMTGARNEMVNSARAYAYAQSAGMGWVQECGCQAAYPAGHVYDTPGTGTVAPWWNGFADSARFLGVIGLDVKGDDSTRAVRVTPTLTTGGVIGPTRYGPREVVLRGLIIATDDLGLEFGVQFVQYTGFDGSDPCSGNSLVYYDCCPLDVTPLGTNRLRQLRGTRITEGPDFLRYHRNMPSGGACAEFEITFTAADPSPHQAGGALLMAEATA